MVDETETHMQAFFFAISDENPNPLQRGLVKIAFAGVLVGLFSLSIIVGICIAHSLDWIDIT